MDKDEMHELPKGWVWTSLEESFDIVLGQSPPSSTYNLNGSGLPFYQGKSEFGNLYPTPKKWCTAPKKISEKGDVLISVRAPVGPTNICSEKSCIGRGLAAIRPLSGIETFFALYLMRAFENIIAGKGTGTTFSAITGDKLKKIYVPIPPLPEQRAIVSKIEQLFSDLDNGIDNFKKAQEQLKIYRQAVLKNACEGKLVPTEAELARAEGRDYEPADVLLARILEERREKWNGKGKYKGPVAPDTSGLAELPEGWIWTNLEQLKLFSLYGPRFSSNDYTDEGYVVLRTSDISEAGKVDVSSAPKLTLSDESYEKYKVNLGDILITRTGSLGTLAVFNDSVKAIPGAYLIQYRLIEDFGISWYIFYFLKTSFGQKHLVVGGAGIGRPNLNAPTIEAIPIPFPPRTEQHRIVTEVERCFSICDKMEETISESLQKAESLRQSILKKAFEGKLLNEKELEEVRNAPDWEPAEKLLESIKAEKQIISKEK